MAKERGGVIDQAAAEALLRRYLDERGWRYEWEQREFGGKRPDAVILSESGEPIAVIGAVAVDEGAELGHTVREALACGIQQASPVAEAGLPYLLAAHIPGCPPLERIAPRIVGELRRAYAISAFGVLRELDAAEIYKRLQKANQSNAYALKPLEVNGMEILLNPQATLAWTQELWGIYDQVWTWDTRKNKTRKIYDGREELMRTYRILLHAGTVPAPFKEGISTSRSEDFYEERY
jgi:hypothetical protein